jgi:hypothetical protein
MQKTSHHRRRTTPIDNDDDDDDDIGPNAPNAGDRSNRNALPMHTAHALLQEDVLEWFVHGAPW